MAIEPKVLFPGQVDASAPALLDYPQGKAQNITVPSDGTGTPFVSSVVNDIWGFFQTLLAKTGTLPNGNPDTLPVGQYYDSFLKLQAFVNPEAFGVVADGVADDTVAMQAALDFLNAAGGGALYLPAGQILISAPLVVHTDCTLIGLYSEIVLDDGSDSAAIEVALGASNVKILNVRIDGNSANNAATPSTVGLIDILSAIGTPAEDIWIEDCVVTDSDQAGVFVNDGAIRIHVNRNRINGTVNNAGINLSASGGTVVNIECIGNIMDLCDGPGIQAIGVVKGAQVSGNTISNAGSSATAANIDIRTASNADVVIENNICIASDQHGIRAGGIGVVIQGNIVRDWDNDGIRVEQNPPGGDSKVIVANNHLIGTSPIASERGIVVFDCLFGVVIAGNTVEDVLLLGIVYENTGAGLHQAPHSINGNTVENSDGGGILVEGGAGIIGGVITGNHTVGIDLASTLYGIRINNVSDHSVTGNTCIDAGIGIDETGVANFNNFVGNTIRLNTIPIALVGGSSQSTGNLV